MRRYGHQQVVRDLLPVRAGDVSVRYLGKGGVGNHVDALLGEHVGEQVVADRFGERPAQWGDQRQPCSAA